MDDFEGALNEAEVSPAYGDEDGQSDSYLASGVDAQVDEDAESLNEGEEMEDPKRGPIPYERFQQVNEQLQDLRQWSQIIDQLRQQGYETPDAVNQALHEQGERQYREQLAGRLEQQVRMGALDGVVAQQQYQNALIQRQLEQDRQMYHQWQAHQTLLIAQQQYPEMDADYVYATHRMTGSNLMELARQSHEDRIAYQERVIAQYNATKKGDRFGVIPEGNGGGAPGRRGMPDPNSPEFDKWYEQELKNTQRVYR